ncbi:MAG: hypothetical protein RLZ51_1865 [Pseudomonadota bacterium]|jgi:hypothetical protein
MPITDDDIRERIEVRGDGVLVWRKLDVPNAPGWMRREAAKLNKRAGEPVQLWRHANGGMMTRLYGCDLYEGRIRQALTKHRAGARAGSGGER